MVIDGARSLWALPRVPRPPARGSADWVLVAVLVVSAAVESALRDDLALPPAAFVLGAAPALALPWRRVRPLAVLAVTFGAQATAELAPIAAGSPPLVLYTTAYVLVVPYVLLRWGSGREVVVGLAVVCAVQVVRLVVVPAGLADAAIGGAFLLLPAVLGAAVRHRVVVRRRRVDQERLRERERLARELHDTVAHHVSAIAVRAQAGRALAGSDPASAVAALEVVEEAASRALTEMRAVVGMLRRGSDVDLPALPGVADVERLAVGSADPPRVEVELSGALDGLRPEVGAALYRIAQESVTNARRHARRAHRVVVVVTGDDDVVRLTVGDDGAGPTGRSTSGYGLVGMTERVALLGGTLEAGPRPGGGWAVTAVLPREGPVG